MDRRRFNQLTPLKDRLAAFAKGLRDDAAVLQPGEAQEDMLNRARCADTASELDEWAKSKGRRLKSRRSKLS